MKIQDALDLHLKEEASRIIGQYGGQRRVQAIGQGYEGVIGRNQAQLLFNEAMKGRIEIFKEASMPPVSLVTDWTGRGGGVDFGASAF